MLAVIRTNDDRTYVSPVFAIREAGWRTEVFVFNETQQFLIRLKVWSPRKVYFVRAEQPFQESRGAWFGYGWMLHHPAARKWYGYRKTIPVEEIPEAREFVKPYILPEWFEVTDSATGEDLMHLTAGFHDSTVERETWEGKNFTVVFDTHWDCVVTVRFANVSEPISLSGCFDEILDSELEFIPQGVRWKVTEWLKDLEYHKSDQPFLLTCEKIFWKMQPCRGKKKDEIY